MAPVINHYLDHSPAVSLLLVKDSCSSKKNVSREDLQQMIYALMLLVGENMSKITNAYAKNQIDQGVIAKDHADDVQKQTVEYCDKLKQQLADQEKWSWIGMFMKVLGPIVAAIAGLVTCGTGGAIMIALTAGLMASPIGEKAIASLADALAKNTEIGKAWGKVVAEVIVIVLVTALTAGTETLEAGLSETTDTVIATSAKWASTKINFLQSLMSTNFVGDFTTQCIELIPGDTTAKKQAETWLPVVIDVVIMFASLKLVNGSTGENAVTQFGKLFGKDGALAEFLLQKVTQGGDLALAAGGMALGGHTVDQSFKTEALGLLEADIAFDQGFIQNLTKLSDAAQKTAQSLIDGNKTLFETNFSRDWQFGAQASLQG